MAEGCSHKAISVRSDVGNISQLAMLSSEKVLYASLGVHGYSSSPNKMLNGIDSPALDTQVDEVRMQPASQGDAMALAAMRGPKELNCLKELYLKPAPVMHCNCLILPSPVRFWPSSLPSLLSGTSHAM